MYCTKCGKQIADDSICCTFCGNTTAKEKIENDNVNINITNSTIRTKKKVYQQWWFWLIIVFLVLSITGMISKNRNKNTETITNVSTEENKDGEGRIGQYYIKVKEYNIVYDGQNKAVLLVKIAFTNNNDESKSFVYTLNAKAYQNGIELITPISSYGIDGLDWNEKSKEVKKGITHEFNIGFYIDNVNENVELEITPLISSRYSQKVTKILEMK